LWKLKFPFGALCGKKERGAEKGQTPDEIPAANQAYKGPREPKTPFCGKRPLFCDENANSEQGGLGVALRKEKGGSMLEKLNLRTVRCFGPKAPPGRTGNVMEELTFHGGKPKKSRPGGGGIDRREKEESRGGEERAMRVVGFIGWGTTFDSMKLIFLAGPERPQIKTNPRRGK